MIAACLRFVVIAWLVCGLPGQAAGQPTATPFSGLDLVIVIDQSGSMWGNPRLHPGQNDPWQHRIGAAKSIVMRLMEGVTRTTLVHHLSIVEFSDAAEVVISRQSIRFDPADPSAHDRLKTLMEVQVTAKDGGNTNTAAALAAADRELAAMRAAGPQAGRRRAILLITDGRATMPGISDAAMRAAIRTQVERLRAADVEPWVVGLNDADEYWNSGEGAFWETLAGAGRARLAESASTSIPTVFQDIADNWLQTRSVHMRSADYECPPYLRRIVFNVTFGRPRGEIRILDPLGREVPRTAGGPPVGPGTFAHYTVDDPLPGVYRIQRDPSRADVVHVEEYSPSLVRLVPPAEADATVETRVVFQARMSAGQPLSLIDAHPLATTLVVSSPAGAVSEAAVEARPDGRFEARWTPPAPGTYRVTLRGLVRRTDGSSYDVFAQNAADHDPSLTVGTRRPHWLRLVDPNPLSGVRAFPWSSSADVRFELIDSARQPITALGGVVREPGTWLTVQSVDRSGDALGPDVPLVEESPGVFAARVPLRLRWRSGEGWRAPGALALRLTAQPDRLQGDRYLSSLLLPPAIEDRRLNGDALSVGPIEVGLALTTWLVAIAFPLVLLAAGAWWVALGWLPTTAVRKQDRARRRQVVLKVYDEAADPSGSNAQEFPVSGGHAFRFDRRLQLTVDGSSHRAERLRVTRRPTPGKAAATLSYRWKGDKKDRPLQLLSGAPRPLDGLPTRSVVALLVESS